MARGLDSQHEQRTFIKQLTETILWCREAGSLSDPRTSLRTFKLELRDMISRHDQVFRVDLDRSRRLSPAAKRTSLPVTTLCGGRLLAYFPDGNLACGTAEAESHGFFDVDNIPPYDTWVWMVRNVTTFRYQEDGVRGEMEADYLVAWVPPDFVQLAAGGINVNPEGCILWLDTLDDEFVRSLRRLGFFQAALSSPSPS